MGAIYPAQESVAEIPNTPPQMGPGGDTSWPHLRTYFINSPLDSQTFLRIFRPDSPFTRDSFSRAQPASTRKSLIFLHPHTAARPAPSDNAKCQAGEQITRKWGLRPVHGQKSECSISSRPLSEPGSTSAAREISAASAFFTQRGADCSNGQPVYLGIVSVL